MAIKQLNSLSEEYAAATLLWSLLLNIPAEVLIGVFKMSPNDSLALLKYLNYESSLLRSPRNYQDFDIFMGLEKRRLLKRYPFLHLQGSMTYSVQMRHYLASHFNTCLKDI
uniref:Uncharacterized protein n=1 Tax=Glossina pallidipes TaxID=7398 RepID=A0A1A9ZBS7_GLOPL